MRWASEKKTNGTGGHLAHKYRENGASRSTWGYFALGALGAFVFVFDIQKESLSISNARSLMLWTNAAPKAAINLFWDAE